MTDGLAFLKQIFAVLQHYISITSISNILSGCEPVQFLIFHGLACNLYLLDPRSFCMVKGVFDSGNLEEEACLVRVRADRVLKDFT